MLLEEEELNTPSISQMMIIMLAFLVLNGLMSLPGSLVFFTDGARDLRLAIQNTFSFIPFKLILDWYHLEKKCKDLLSMAMKGKQVKNQILTEVLAWLWLGKVERAMKLLRDVSQETIKNQKELNNLITYLDRNSSCIPCYALRKKLGLRISRKRHRRVLSSVWANHFLPGISGEVTKFGSRAFITW